MTSNLGVKKLQDFGTGVGFKTTNNSYIEEEQKRDVLKKELQKFFTPEFLNRIDEVIVFNSLKKEDILKIVNLEFEKLTKRLVDLKYNITIDDSIKNMISEVGFDEMYGARPLKRAIQDKVEDFISEEVIKGTIKENGMYHISYKDEKVVFVELDETTQEEPKKEKKKKTSQKKPKV